MAFRKVAGYPNLGFTNCCGPLEAPAGTPNALYPWGWQGGGNI